MQSSPAIYHARDCSGKTSLHYAAEMGHLEALEAFIYAGVDINARDNTANKWTPLGLALSNNHSRIVEVLSASGARK